MVIPMRYILIALVLACAGCEPTQTVFFGALAVGASAANPSSKEKQPTSAQREDYRREFYHQEHAKPNQPGKNP